MTRRLSPAGRTDVALAPCMRAAFRTKAVGFLNPKETCMNTRSFAVAPLAGAVLAFGLCTTATAAPGQWDTALGPGSGSGATSASPWIASPAPGSVYAEWNFMGDDEPLTLTIEDRTPDIAAFGLGAGPVRLAETSGTAFVTGGGNIYALGGAGTFTLEVPGITGTPMDVWLRAATLGDVMAESATLNGVAATLVPTFTSTLGGAFGGTEQEVYWMWSNVAPAASLNFAFAAASSSLSLDQVAVYAAPVPEPGTYALMALGLAGVAFSVRRRTR